MGFSLDIDISALTVFVQGLLSFFSPCVLPLIPLYIGYLSGGTAQRGEDGRIHYKKSKVMLHTVFFVLGVSFAFFILGLGVSALGSFFNKNHLLFARIGGVLVAVFGLYQIGIFGKKDALEKERRLPFRLNTLAMSPVTALIMGFTFSFAWTPCVGPALASVLIMAASAQTQMAGFVLIGVYTLGFVLPFLAVGLFTTTLLEFFKNHMNVVKYTVKIGGILMVVMGILMITGKMNAVTGYLSDISAVSQEETEKEETGGEDTDSAEDADENKAASGEEEPDAPAEKTETADTSQTDTVLTDALTPTPTPVPAIDFTLKDQYGETHSLADYKGKTIFLNFWATWCPPCKAEMPDIQKIYETYDQEGEDALIVLGVAAPNYGNEGSEEEITEFLEENGYTYPVLMDTDASLFTQYGIYSYPTTFMIDRDGNLFGYVTGQLSEEIMHDIISQTMEGVRK